MNNSNFNIFLSKDLDTTVFIKKKDMKVLFLLKERFYNNTPIKSYGLINSSLLVSKFLIKSGCESKVETVIDGNFIDKEVYNYKPDVVIIEALWVSGDKMKELIEIKRYKDIKWIVRIHSDIGYLSAETLALKYINDYIGLNKPNLFIAPNNEKFNEYLSNAMNYNFKWLPNIVEIKHSKNKPEFKSDCINIGCFGSLRLLKNQVFQAMCAMKAADILNKTLSFHISTDVNISNSEANPILKNLEELFKNSRHELVKHVWKENKSFQHLIRMMDLGLQLSYTESFNIVAADFINNGIPILVSEAIEWMPKICKTSTTDYDLVVKKIVHFYNHRDSIKLKKEMQEHLIIYNKEAEKIWLEFIF